MFLLAVVLPFIIMSSSSAKETTAAKGVSNNTLTVIRDFPNACDDHIGSNMQCLVIKNKTKFVNILSDLGFLGETLQSTL